MQKLTSREAWVRFATVLYSDTDMTPSDVASAADQLLVEYLLRFPDPEEAESAVIEGNNMVFTDSGEEEDSSSSELTEFPADTPSERVG